VIGCGALHLYGQHLAEVRSIAVARDARKQGAGSRLVAALLKESRQHHVAQVCLFTRSPEYFGRLGFIEVPHAVLPDKIFKDCRNCPMFTRCDEIAMVYAGATVHAVAESDNEIDAVLRPERQPALATLVQIGRVES
jgi:amino-acid N-acetyltransferase